MPKRLRRLFRRPPTVSVLRLYGAIGLGGRFGSGLSDRALAQMIGRAFAGKPKAVALAINSPGGSAAQSALIAARIRRAAEKEEVPVYAFCEDVAASGGYWLACAADEIYADANSVVGSIGVIYAAFGLHELLERNGVERRVHTAGAHKSMLDPFSPEKPEDVERLKSLQSAIHDNFKAHVREQRGDRLSDADLFTGEIWVGAHAQQVGLIDGLGHLVPVMREKFGEEVEFRDLSARRGLLQRLGMPGAADLIGAAEERMLWSRYGL